MSSDDQPEAPAPGEEATPADDAVPERDATPAEDARPARTSGSRPPAWAVYGSAALAAAAFVVAVVFGVLWWVAAADDDNTVAKARDDVAHAASTAVTAFTELDYQDPDAYFQRQKEITTGELHASVSQSEDNFRKAISEAKTTVESTVQDVAVEELNVHEGEAVVLATVSNKVTQGDKQSTKALRLELRLTRVDDNGEQVWKLSGIGEVPVVGRAGS